MRGKFRIAASRKWAHGPVRAKVAATVTAGRSPIAGKSREVAQGALIKALTRRPWNGQHPTFDPSGRRDDRGGKKT